VSRSSERAGALAELCRAPHAVADPANLPESVDIVCLCVPDGTIDAWAQRLAALRPDWAGATAFHFSGTLDTEALSALSDRGALAVAFHPLQSFTRGAGPSRFEGIYCGVTAEAGAAPVVAQFAAILGVSTVPIAASVRPAYHMAATVSSNFVVTLLSAATDVLVHSGIDEDAARTMLLPLAEGAIGNMKAVDPGAALTGPVVRGDAETVARHLDILARDHPELDLLYRRLAEATIALAGRSGRLAPEQAGKLRELVQHPVSETADQQSGDQ
jgi:predicted short-subunit dehydrogenase-like oxidoreductase (DUF2520 family)